MSQFKKGSIIKIKTQQEFYKYKHIPIVGVSKYTYWFDLIIEKNCCGKEGVIFMIDSNDKELPYYVKIKDYIYWVHVDWIDERVNIKISLKQMKNRKD